MVWLGLGGFVLVFAQPAAPPPNYLPWSRDFTGIVLVVILAVIATSIWWQTSTLEQQFPRHQKWKEDAKVVLVFAAPFVLGLCAVLIYVNYATVTKGTPKVWWSHHLWPHVLPFTIAFVYYLMCVLPVLLCVVRYGRLLAFAADNCTSLDGFTLEDPDRCCGLGWYGALRVYSLCLIVTVVTAPMLTQLFMYREVTGGSVIVAAFGVLLILYLVVWPLLVLKIRLAEVIRTELDNAAPNDPRLPAIRAQSTVPIGTTIKFGAEVVSRMFAACIEFLKAIPRPK